MGFHQGETNSFSNVGSILSTLNEMAGISRPPRHLDLLVGGQLRPVYDTGMLGVHGRVADGTHQGLILLAVTLSTPC